MVLEYPFHAKTWVHVPAFGVVASEVACNLNFSANVEVRTVEELTDTVPKLWLGNEYACGFFYCRFELWIIILDCPFVCFPPIIGKTTEIQASKSKEVLAAPNDGKLQRYVLL